MKPVVLKSSNYRFKLERTPTSSIMRTHSFGPRSSS